MELKDLKSGMTVTYVPKHAWKQFKYDYSVMEVGKVKRWNDRYVFVDYNGSVQATSLVDLRKGDQSFYCPDENNSVLDGAFGRCSSECHNCKL